MNEIKQQMWKCKILWNAGGGEENIPNTVNVAMATVKFRVPGIVARQTYIPACCSLTSDIMRLPFPSTRVLKTSMDLWSISERNTSVKTI